MHPLKYTYDVLGERALSRLNEISPPPRSVLPRSHSAARRCQDVKEEEARSQRDLFAILRDNKDDPVLSPLWKEVNTVPDWVDWSQLARGQDVFYRYGGANLTGLAYQSLLGGMGAARVVETLARTGGFSTKVARRRLYETTQHILQVTKSLDSVQPGGEGWASTIRVRLLHAAVRQRILKLAKERPEYYSVEKFGIPINDLDSLATISTFSTTLIWLALPRQGLFLRSSEIGDYLALWRYVGYVIGAPTDSTPWFSDAKHAKMLMESLLYHEITPSDTSKVLTHNLIRCLEGRPPLYATDSMLIASARWLNGHELCDQLALKRVPVYYMALMAGQCVFFMVMCYVYRAIPSWDRWKIEFLRKGFWTMIVESGSGLKGEVTGFEFKYVPEFATITQRDESEETAKRDSGIERRNLKWLIMFVAGLGIASWLGVKMMLGIVKRLLG
jgi:hypothetical protein